VLFYAEALLAHYESQGIPVVNPVAAYRFEKSKALQLGLFERVGARYPRSIVVNHPIQALAALDKLRLPVVVKPNVGGSGAGIVRVDSKAELESAVDRLDLGPDGTALVQEYVESAEGAIVRVEVLGGEYLYAIRIVRDAQAGFNLCPADICQVPAGAATPRADLGACPASAPLGLTVGRFDAPAEAIDTVIRLARAASIDVGGVEYLVSKADGRVYYYDVNSTSNFVANAEAVIGFDPTARFADLIVRRARREVQATAALESASPRLRPFRVSGVARPRSTGAQLRTGGTPWRPAAQ
jgi:glutathione synthase/RimK-type ligase-like ATP-grasp enzyme